MKLILLFAVLVGCVIQVEIPTSKTILEKQISGEIKPTDEAVLMRAVTRGESSAEVLEKRSDSELESLEKNWFELAKKHLDSGYIGFKKGTGLLKVEKNFDDSEEAIEALIVASRLNTISREILKRREMSLLLNENYFANQRGWWIEKDGVWVQSGAMQ